MSSICAPGLPVIGDTEIRAFAFDFGPLLASGELLTGTPTVTEITTSDLTIANVALNSSAMVVNARSASANEVVTGTVKGTAGTINKEYTLLITATSNASPAQTFHRHAKLKVVEDNWSA